MEHLDIAYGGGSGRDRLRELDVYVPTVRSPAASPLLVFVHGGAWRSEDKSEHSQLARSLAESTRCAVAVPNYTLTPPFRHPLHAEDILHALEFLRTWQPPNTVGQLYNQNALHLIGHSCSAHILASIFLDSSSVTPSLTPSPELASAVKSIIMSEGIYDLDQLLASFPAYRQWFIADAFGSLDSYAKFSVNRLPLAHSHIHWLILHSKGDSLVDLLQSQVMHKRLSDLYGPHQVRFDFDKLVAGHNEILGTDEYVRIIADFVSDVDKVDTPLLAV